MKKRNIVSFLVGIYMVTGALLAGFGMLTNRVVTVFSEYRADSARRTVVIDAGHGGEDGGAVSCTGVTESTLNLEIALRLEKLCSLLGMKTAMIRTTDTAVYTSGTTIAAKKVSDLKRRVEIVNGTKNALLVSIHQNTYPDASCTGAQVFYAKGQESAALAKHLQQDLIRCVNIGGHRKEKNADGIYLMEHISCPGVLVECGFLSNPNEEALLRTADYQKKLCCVIACAIELE